MVESLSIPVTDDRTVVYDEIVPQIRSLVLVESDLTANLANIAAALKQAFGFFWVGFYLVNDGELVLGPFQGPVACTRIKYDQGVCGHAYSTRETVIVPDVNEFPGHIACASEALSEIVVPIFASSGEVFGVLDVDSTELDDFSVTDADGLSKVVGIIEELIAK